MSDSIFKSNLELGAIVKINILKLSGLFFYHSMVNIYTIFLVCQIFQKLVNICYKIFILCQNDTRNKEKQELPLTNLP